MSRSIVPSHTMAPAAPVVLRKGHVLMHINDPKILEQGVAAMRDEPRCDDAAYISTLASAAGRV